MYAASGQYGLFSEGCELMSAVGNYVLTVIVTAFLCAVISDLVQDPSSKAIIRMVSGMILTITVAAPVCKIDVSSCFVPDSSVMDAASAAAAEGAALSREALRLRIKQDTESYIQEKAEIMNTYISAEIAVSNDDLPVPVSVLISGTVSPSARQKLQRILETDLGITKENIEWTG